MKYGRIASAAGALALMTVSAQLGAQSGQPAQLTQAQATSLVKAMKPQHGHIAIAEAKASLDLGNSYDFYGPDDARTILVSLWNNPPSAASGVLGLVMPAGASPLSDTWGAVITYEKSGYVADDDAAETDFNELLGQLKQAQEEGNPQRKSAGYPEMHLVGWADSPHYDKATHSVVWARDLQIAGASADSLNYDVRTLGRNGVLSLNLIAAMPQLPQIKSAAQAFASHASFDKGARYEDFDASIDQKAEYGIGGLIAAGAGVVVAKKLGLLAVFLKFLKPALIAVVAAFAVLRKKVAGLFGRNKDPLEG